MSRRTRLRQRIEAYRQGDRAVSPVIGVILMVAITVILAAIIGAYALQLNQSQQTAPEAQIEPDQRSEDVNMTNGASQGTRVVTDVVTLRHNGGDRLFQEEVHLRTQVENGSETITARGIGIANGTATSDPLWNTEEEGKIRAPDRVSVAAYVNQENTTAAITGIETLEPMVEGVATCGIGAQPGGSSPEFSGSSDQFRLTVNASDHADAAPAAAGCAGGGSAADVQSWDNGGILEGGETILVVWSPKESDESSILVEYEVD